MATLQLQIQVLFGIEKKHVQGTQIVFMQKDKTISLLNFFLHKTDFVPCIHLFPYDKDEKLESGEGGLP